MVLLNQSQSFQKFVLSLLNKKYVRDTISVVTLIFELVDEISPVQWFNLFFLIFFLLSPSELFIGKFYQSITGYFLIVTFQWASFLFIYFHNINILLELNETSILKTVTDALCNNFYVLINLQLLFIYFFVFLNFFLTIPN